MGKLKNNSGIIILSVLWILAILALLALSLGKSSNTELELAQYSIAKTKAYAAARAGISYTLNLLEKRPSGKDTLFACGVNIDGGRTPEDYFKDVKVSDSTHFEISFLSKDYGDQEKAGKYYGLRDEARRVNLNALDGTNFSLLSSLMQNVGVEADLAEQISLAVLAWQGKSQVSEFDQGQSQIHKKNRPFDGPEELMLIKGMTPDIYNKIKDYITVFPKAATEGLRINFHTAPQPVMRAALTTWAPSLDQQTDIEKTQQDITQFQQGPDGQFFTADDAASGNAPLSIQTLSGALKSQYYRIRSVGVEELSRVRVVVEAVVNFDETNSRWEIASWHRS